MAPTVALGAAFRPWSPLVFAGNVTGTHMDAFGNDGMGWGLTMGLQVLQSLYLETGIVQNRNESRTMPVALRLVTKGGWEMGLRMDDVFPCGKNPMRPCPANGASCDGTLVRCDIFAV